MPSRVKIEHGHDVSFRLVLTISFPLAGSSCRVSRCGDLLFLRVRMMTSRGFVKRAPMRVRGESQHNDREGNSAVH
jgi:hypothetical protein